MQGDKGKLRVSGPTSDGIAHHGEDAIWAVILTKELWRKGTWTDAKPVAIVALGCFHPVMKVQTASIHFFLGSDEDKEDSDDEEDDVCLYLLATQTLINRCHCSYRTLKPYIIVRRSTRKQGAVPKNYRRV